MFKTFKLLVLVSLLSDLTYCQDIDPIKYKVEKCKLAVLDGLVFIIKGQKELFTKDTIDVLDLGDVGRDCIEDRNGNFVNEEYNFFREYRARHLYFDKKKEGAQMMRWVELNKISENDFTFIYFINFKCCYRLCV